MAGVGDRVGGLAVGAIVTVSARLPATGRAVVRGVVVLLGEQLLQEQELGQDERDDGHDQRLLGDQRNAEQGQDGQTDDLQLHQSEDGQQSLQDLLLAAGLSNHGAHLALHLLRDDGGQAAGSTGHIEVQRALAHEADRAVEHVVLQRILARFHTVGRLDLGTFGVVRAGVTAGRLHEREATGQADLRLVEEVTRLTVELEKRSEQSVTALWSLGCTAQPIAIDNYLTLRRLLILCSSSIDYQEAKN